jgi:hypothetical protein
VNLKMKVEEIIELRMVTLDSYRQSECLRKNSPEKITGEPLRSSRTER